MQRTTPSKTDGVEIELPDFDELFHRIVEVSPLAGLAISGEGGGFSVADEKCKLFFRECILLIQCVLFSVIQLTMRLI